MLARVRHWLKNTGPAEGAAQAPAHPFQVSCACGNVLKGIRQAAHQVMPCPVCGADIFILPTSPWLERAQPRPAGPAAPPAPSLRPRDWLLPIAACALAVFGLVLVYHFLLAPVLAPSRNEDSALAPADPRALLLGRLSQAQKSLNDGNFRLALKELRDHNLDLARLTSADRAVWRRLEREAALLADLLAEPLEEVLHHAAAVRGEEWEIDFRHRYLGKAVVLDCLFRKTQDGWQANYPLFLGAERARIVVADLQALKALEAIERVPPHETQRLVLGARLASLKLEAPGPTWVLRFLPESGVFLTHPDAAARLYRPLADPESRALVESQARWAD